MHSSVSMNHLGLGLLLNLAWDQQGHQSQMDCSNIEPIIPNLSEVLQMASQKVIANCKIHNQMVQIPFDQVKSWFRNTLR